MELVVLFLVIVALIIFLAVTAKMGNSQPAVTITKTDAYDTAKDLLLKLKRFENVKINQVFMDDNDEVASVRRAFLAFDVETTGLDPNDDRIVEIGAVLFVDGDPVSTFSSLVNAGISVSFDAYKVNHISDEMLRHAPTEEEVYPRLIEFLGDAVTGDTIMCAHNARFDFGFLRNTFCRLGYAANIRYADTLSLARRYIHDLPDYKQATLEKYFGLKNYASHRAGADAENCGKILYRMLGRIEKGIEAQRRIESQTAWLNQAQILWDSGEEARKAGRFNEAFRFYDQAKAIDAAPWFLYEGYAKAYRKLNDQDSELAILNEGISKIGPEYSSALVERREKLLARIAAKEQAQRIASEKEAAREQKRKDRQERLDLEAQKPKKPAGRAVFQLAEDGTLIKEFSSIAEAARETGINNKSIRCAATGTQKHAGGYRWKYRDSDSLASESL